MFVLHSERWHLGSLLEIHAFTEEYFQESVAAWKSELERQSHFAKTELHATFTAQA